MIGPLVAVRICPWGFNFIAADRGRVFLLPPDMRDWLPADHLVWFVIDVVDQLDLSRFRAAYRADGHGRPAYDPAVLVAVLLYTYCNGLRSSRLIERNRGKAHRRSVDAYG